MDDLKDYAEVLEKEPLEDFLKRHLQNAELEYLRLMKNQPFHPMVNTYLSRILKLRLMLESAQGSSSDFEDEWVYFTIDLIRQIQAILCRGMDEEQKKNLFEEAKLLAQRCERNFRDKIFSRKALRLKTIKKYAPQ